MRRRWRWGTVAGVLLVLAWLAARETREAPPRTRDRGARVTPARGGPGARAVVPVLPTLPASTAPRLRGWVRGPGGPVGGAEILASRVVEGESFPTQLRDNPVTDEQFAQLVADRAGEASVVAQTRSEADGSFSLEGLEPGHHTLWAQAPEGSAMRHEVEADAKDVELVLGPGVGISGSVQDQGGRPLEGARVTAIFEPHSRFFETLTDARGGFALGSLPRGRYLLLVAREGMRPVRDVLRVQSSGVRREYVLESLRRLSGRVVSAGRPVPGAQVLLRPARSLAERETLTDGEGRFSFEGVRPGTRHLLRAWHEPMGASARHSVEEEGAGDAKELLLELSPMARVRGRMVDEDGKPLSQAVIFGEQAGEDSRVLIQGTRTDAEGEYLLGPFPTGLLYLRPEVEGYREPRERPPVSLSAGTHRMDLVLARMPRVEGLVVDARGQPVAGEALSLSRVDALDEDSASWGTSGQDGRFSIKAREPGRYQLTVDGRQSRSQTLVVQAPTSVRLVVERLPRVEGDVVDERGEPVARARVKLQTIPDGEETGSDLTDAQGRFSIGARSLPGPHVLVAELAGEDLFQSTRERVQVGERGAHARLRLTLGRPLSGRVEDRRGRPVPGAMVIVEAPREDLPRRLEAWQLNVFSNSQGYFRFQSLPEGPAELSVHKEGYTLACQQAQAFLVLGAETREQRVVLAREAHVTGRLVREDGTPVAEGLVNREPLADDEGRFSWPVGCARPLLLELSEPEPRPGVAPVRRSVIITDQEADVELGTIVLGRD